jgi:hypothetical protein
MSKDEEKQENPEPSKDNKFIGFVKRHKTKLIVVGGVTIGATLVGTILRQEKLASRMMEFIEEQDLTDKFLGLEAPEFPEV